MKAPDIEKLFFDTIAERGIYKSIGVDRTTVSKWKSNPPSLGLMVEVLLKLNKIKIEQNDTGGTATGRNTQGSIH